MSTTEESAVIIEQVRVPAKDSLQPSSSHCAALQTSNTFLAQTSLSLYQILEPQHNRTDGGEVKTPDSNKKWCII